MSNPTPRMIERASCAGQIHEDRWENRLVRLISLIDRDAESSSNRDVDYWLIEDLLTGRIYETPTANLSSRQVGEMEVLAFIAKEGANACACCGRDGGRTFEAEKLRFCGACFRASCDTHRMPCRLAREQAQNKEATPAPASL